MKIIKYVFQVILHVCGKIYPGLDVDTHKELFKWRYESGKVDEKIKILRSPGKTSIPRWKIRRAVREVVKREKEKSGK